ncbi:ClpX C4-type zinc finger protein [Actinopolymorpha sp. NPDC004070]|uniref:ClpX C4-type zinc finger protein n=1 Tax=Actinopolymorpha sp. NPDC004070 TaxID=3154548 RepID=UPI0033BE0E09
MTLDEELLAKARTARERLVSLQHDAEIAQADYHYAIRVLHAGGGSMREIADALDLSHQRVHQVVDAGDPAAARRSAERGDRDRTERDRDRTERDRERAERDRGRAEQDRDRAERDRQRAERAERRKAQAEERRERTERRLTRRAERRNGPDQSGAEHSGPPGVPGYDRLFADTRHVLDLAREEAVGFGHNYIGTESLLLGLIRADQGTTGRLLSAAGVDLETARAGVERLIGRGTESVDAELVPMTPRAAKVVELALREARHDRADLARGEHLLLALLREGKGVAAQILAEADFGRYDDVRRRLGRAGLRCSFCGRDGLRTDRLIAGPEVFVCRECVDDAAQLLAGEEPDSPEAADRLTLVADGMGGTDRDAAACGFCGRPGAEVGQLVAGPDTAICAGCVELCGQIADEPDSGRR